jgi:hypothetical protein
MKTDQRTPMVSVGIISLLTLLTVLMLTAFSVLSLVSARSDLRLNELAAQAVGDYYEADGQAERWWMGLCQTVSAAQPQDLPQRLSAGSYAFEADGEGYRITATFPVGTAKVLQAEALATPGADGVTLTRTQWRTAALPTHKEE